MNVTGKIYKVLYVTKTGDRITDPSVINGPLLPKRVLIWDKTATGYAAIVSGKKRLELVGWGIHWFTEIKKALETYDWISVSTESFKTVSKLELWEGPIPTDEMLVNLLFDLGCSYRVKVTKKLADGEIQSDGRVIWTRVETNKPKKGGVK